MHFPCSLEDIGLVFILAELEHLTVQPYRTQSIGSLLLHLQELSYWVLMGECHKIALPSEEIPAVGWFVISIAGNLT